MIVTAADVLAALLALTPYPDQGDDAARVALLTPVAEAIVYATGGSIWRASALASIAMHESALARYVLEGRCKDGPRGARCDEGHARGPWQVHRWCSAWSHPDGSYESRKREAVCADRLVRSAWKKCRTLPGIFAGYATGNRACEWHQAAARTGTMGFAQRVMVREAKKREQ